MASSRVPRPAFLNPVSSQTDEDAPLVRSQVAAVWPFVEHFARHEARRVLSRVPLEGARSLASRKGVFAAVIADQGAIRHALRQNEVDDLVQAVAVAFIEAVDRGAVRSSEHAVRGWIRAVTWLVGARASRTPAALLFGAGPADDSDDGPNGHAFTAQAREPSPEDLAALRQDCGMVAQHLARLSAKLRAVVDLWLEGLGYAEIATTLGITPGTARLRLFRALDALRTALMPRAGPRRRRGGRRPFGRRELGGVERRTGERAGNLLTPLAICGIVNYRHRGTLGTAMGSIGYLVVGSAARASRQTRPCGAPRTPTRRSAFRRGVVLRRGPAATGAEPWRTPFHLTWQLLTRAYRTSKEGSAACAPCAPRMSVWRSTLRTRPITPSSIPTGGALSRQSRPQASVSSRQRHGPVHLTGPFSFQGFT